MHQPHTPFPILPTRSEWAAAVILAYAVLSGSLYLADTNIVSGALFGLAGAWIGLTIQHCGNHGAMSTNTAVNNFMGLCNDIMGGSSLMWRYHHQARCGALCERWLPHRLCLLLVGARVRAPFCAW